MSGSDAVATPKWTGRSRGGRVGNLFFIVVCRFLGLRVAYFFLFFVAGYFVAVERKASRASAEFLTRLLGPASWIRRAGRTYRHFFTFGVSLLDKVAILGGGAGKFSYTFEGEEHLVEALTKKKGMILLTAHVGNWEAAGQLLSRLDAPCSIVGVDKEIESIRRMYSSAVKDAHVTLIKSSGGYEHSIEIIGALRRGEIVAMMGDRGSGSSTVKSEFLGKEAFFPSGAYLLAAITGAPLVQAFIFRERGFRYHFVGFPPRVLEMPARENRREFLEANVKEYVRRLEGVIRTCPYQWYNFFPFWEDRGEASPEPAR